MRHPAVDLAVRRPPRPFVLACLLALPAALSSCSPPSSSTAAAPSAPPSAAAPARVDGAEAHRLVAAGALLLDVRSPDEFSDGHIEGAVNIPVDQVGARLSSLPRDKPIVVYCAMGSRSAAAATRLAAAGFNVKNLGPMAAWNR